MVEDALDRGHLESGDTYVVPNMASHRIANEARLSVNRAARRRNLSPSAWVTDQDGQSCYKDCQDPDAPHGVRFRLFAKNQARAHIFQQTGGDPANLKYNPWKSAPRHGDDGRI